MFYQLFGLSFWRHPFTAEQALVSKWCNATFLQIWWKNKLILILDGLRVRIFSEDLHVVANYSFNTIVKRQGTDVCIQDTTGVCLCVCVCVCVCVCLCACACLCVCVCVCVCVCSSPCICLLLQLFLNCIIIYLFTAEKQNMLCVLLSSVVIVLCFKKAYCRPEHEFVFTVRSTNSVHPSHH